MHTKDKEKSGMRSKLATLDLFKKTLPLFRIFREIYLTWPTFKLVYVSLDSKNANSTPNTSFSLQYKIKRQFMCKNLASREETARKMRQLCRRHFGPDSYSSNTDNTTFIKTDQLVSN